MQGLAVPLGKGLVGHSLHQVLEESGLSAIRRPRIGLEAEDLFSLQRREVTGELLDGHAAQRGERVRREGLAQHGSALDEPSFLLRQSVKPCRDQRVEAFWNLERVDVAGGTIARALA